MFCTKCGKQIPEGSKFCAGCGTQIAQFVPNQIKPQQPKMRPPQIQQPNRQPIEIQNNSNTQDPNVSFHLQKTQETKKMENKNKHMMIILLVILLILIFVAVGMAAYYFLVLRNDNHDKSPEVNKVTKERDKNDEEEDPEEEDGSKVEPDSVNEEDAEEELSGTGYASEQEDEAKVTSDTNEVIKDTIIYSIPKSAYSYDFDEDLGNARVVVRDTGDTMPEITDDKEPQYVVGIDGKAVYLDGTYGIRLDDVQRVGTSYTIAFWMKADTFYDWAPFIHIGYNLLDSNQRCRLWIGQKTDRTSIAPILSSEQIRSGSSYEIRPTGPMTSMQPGVWYHVAFAVDGTRQGDSSDSVRGTVYVAGQRVGEGNIALDTMDVDNPDVYLGINCWDALYPVAFDGVKIWDQVLDDSQIEELFNAYQ